MSGGEDWTEELRKIKSEICVRTLSVYLQNIVSHPDDPKYRRINTQNANFQTRVAAADPHGISFLKGVGFIQDGTFLAYRGMIDPALDPENAKEVNREVLEAALAGLQELAQHLPPVPQSPSAGNQSMTSDAEARMRYQEEVRQRLRAEKEEKERLHRQLQVDQRDREADRKAHEGVMYSDRSIVHHGVHAGAPTGPATAMVGIQHADSGSEFDTLVSRAGSHPLIVDFYADWCGPCRMIAPLFEKLSQEFAGKAVFVKVNVDAAQDVAARFAVSAMPTFIVVKNGRSVDSMRGANAQGLEAMVRKHVV
jgi:thioredoxin